MNIGTHILNYTGLAPASPVTILESQWLVTALSHLTQTEQQQQQQKQRKGKKIRTEHFFQEQKWWI